MSACVLYISHLSLSINNLYVGLLIALFIYILGYSSLAILYKVLVIIEGNILMH